MSSEKNEPDAKDINRRQFLMVGAAGAAGIALAGSGMSPALAQPKAPSGKAL